MRIINCIKVTMASIACVSASAFAVAPVQTTVASATPTAPTIQLDPTLQKIKDSGVMLIGVRASSAPLSYLVDGKYIGMAVDLCLDDFKEVQKLIPGITYKFVEVDSKSRIPALLGGKIDVECGSTTNSASRRQQVSFSITDYIAGITGVARKTSHLNTLNDLKDGDTVVYTAETTTEEAVKTFSWGYNLKAETKKVNRVLATDHQAGFNYMSEDKAKAFINDDILLRGLVAQSAHPEDYSLFHQTFSTEPYGIMVRKDSPVMLAMLNRMIKVEMESGEFTRKYNQWFMSPIPPKGANLNTPMSPLLNDVVRAPTTVTGN